MRRTWITGLILALMAGALVLYGSVLGLQLSEFAVLGAAIGAALGLLPVDDPGRRAAGWGVGFLVAWIGYGMRAAELPDTAGGRAVAAILVILVITAASALSGGWVPLWAELLGVASVAGAYEVSFTNAPAAFVSESVTATTTVALATALGFLATSAINQIVLAGAGWTAPDEDIVPIGSRISAAVAGLPTQRDAADTRPGGIPFRAGATAGSETTPEA